MRVSLHPPTSRDRAEFLARVRASRSLHRPWVYPPADVRAYQRYVRRCTSATHVGFLIRQKADRSLVGVVNVNEIVHGGLQSGYLGFYAFAEHAARGLMSEGLGLVIRHAFGTLRLHRVEANVQPDNARSLGLVQRLGFEREGFSPRYLKIGGRWRDHERWALRAEAWRALRRRP